MEAHEINPFIRYAELRTCSVSYKTPVCAYDYRIFIMKEGECTVVVEEGVLSLCKDCCLIIPPGRPYRFLFNAHAPAVMYNINFSLSYLPGNGRALRPDMPERFRPAHMPEQPDSAFFPVTTLIENVSSDIGQYAADLLSARDGRELFFNEICSSLLKCILLRLRRMPREGERQTPVTVSEVKRYLEEHCRENITGEQLGKLFGYHPFYLNRLFRRYTGQTIHLFQMQCRMKLACTMLTTTLLTVREIADSLGFSTPAYFCELFKKLRGVTPLDYRNGMR